MAEDEVAKAWEALRKKKAQEKREEEEKEAIKEIEENLDEIIEPEEEHFSGIGLMKEIKESEKPAENLEKTIGLTPRREEEKEEEQSSLYAPKKEIKYESAEPERMATFTRFEEPEEIFHRPRKVDLAIESPFEEYVTEVEEKPPEHRKLDEGSKEFARRYKVHKTEGY